MTIHSLGWACMTTLILASNATCAELPPLNKAPKHVRPATEKMLEPLLRYLRCEQVPLDQFGQAQVPDISFDYLIGTQALSENPGQPFTLTVWHGLSAQIHVLAGYGFFGLLQFYTLDQRHALLKALGDAGWTMKRQTAVAAGREGGHGPDLGRLYATYEATKPMGALTRRMTLHEARVYPLTEEIDLDGMTLICTYDKPYQR